jgi:hypothetical protein
MRRRHDEPGRKPESAHGAEPPAADADDPATEEDLQPRDASEMPHEPQNPVNPEPETAS